MLFPTDFLACAVCMPDQTSEVARAASMTLLFMLGVLFVLLGIVIKIMFNFARREREHQQSSATDSSVS